MIDKIRHFDDYIESHRPKMLIEMALSEDIGTGDITSEAILAEELHAIGRIAAKQELILAGIDIARRTFEYVDPDMHWDPKHKDGSHCKPGEVLAIVQGKARNILMAERTALNFLQHMSGIATEAQKYVDAVAGTNVMVLDTRKTTPGHRSLEKYAAKMGGITNHRIGLYDHFLIKNNHLTVAGSVSQALEMVKKARQPGQLLEVEARILNDVEAAAAGGADTILLDNMAVDDVRKAVKLVKGRSKLEVSGNITLDNIRAYAETGIDFISVGAITHSAPAADINMLVMIEHFVGEQSISSLDSLKTPKKR